MTDSNQNENLNGWEPCPAGALAGTAERERSVQNRRMFFINAGMAAVLGAAGYGAYASSWPRKSKVDIDRLTCVEVKAHLAAYIQKTLDDKLRRSIELHLAACTACSNCYKLKLDMPEQLRNPVVYRTGSPVVDECRKPQGRKS